MMLAPWGSILPRQHVQHKQVAAGAVLSWDKPRSGFGFSSAVVAPEGPAGQPSREKAVPEQQSLVQFEELRSRSKHKAISSEEVRRAVKPYRRKHHARTSPGGGNKGLGTLSVTRGIDRWRWVLPLLG